MNVRPIPNEMGEMERRSGNIDIDMIKIMMEMGDKLINKDKKEER